MKPERVYVVVVGSLKKSNSTRIRRPYYGSYGRAIEGGNKLEANKVLDEENRISSSDMETSDGVSDCISVEKKGGGAKERAREGREHNKSPESRHDDEGGCRQRRFCRRRRRRCRCCRRRRPSRCGYYGKEEREGKSLERTTLSPVNRRSDGT